MHYDGFGVVHHTHILCCLLSTVVVQLLNDLVVSVGINSWRQPLARTQLMTLTTIQLTQPSLPPITTDHSLSFFKVEFLCSTSNQIHEGEILHSCCNEYEPDCLLGYCTVQSHRKGLMFWGDALMIR
jgi:hypothetical protein